MENDQYQNDDQYQQSRQAPPHTQDQQSTRPKQNWDTTVNTRALGLIVAVVAIVVVVGFGLSMCSRASTTAPGASLGDGYNVLERRVEKAFEMDGTQGSGGQSSEGGIAPAQPTTSEVDAGAAPPRTNGGDTAISAEERQMQDIQEQQRMMQQQEEMRDAQREAVPSILPEKPPRPVPLGGDNY